ncbi:MAG: hypothetical protein ACRERD_29175 [Candidatus Binatia bacterium]
MPRPYSSFRSGSLLASTTYEDTAAAWHQTRGAVLIDDRGITLPEHFTDPVQEYQAVRTKAGLIDLSFRVQVRVTGEDRITFLHGMLSNDIKGLRAGEGCAATFLTEQGRIVADLRVYALDTCFLLDMDARIKEKTLETLSRFLIADDVELEDLSATHLTVALQGPLAAEVLAAVGVSRSLTTRFQHGEATLADTKMRIVRASDTGEDGYELLVPYERAEIVWPPLVRRPTIYNDKGLLTKTISYSRDGSPYCETPYGYDAQGRLTARLFGCAHEIAYIYDPRGNLTEEIFYSPSSSIHLRSVHAYDAHGHRTSTTNYSHHNPGLGIEKVVTAYDARGNTKELTTYYTQKVGLEDRPIPPPVKWIYTYEFDAYGNWVKQTRTSCHAESGSTMVCEPSLVTYRTITYYSQTAGQ